MDSFRHKKSLGQNFIKDINIVKKIVDSAIIDKNTLVIEIGPGEGVMSELIVSSAKYTIMYEIDERLIDILNKKLYGCDNYKIINNDFLKEDVVREIEKYKYDKLYVVSNLPYYITTPIVEKFIDDGIIPDKLVLMMQKEVALRYSASVNTKDYGSLTVILNYFYDIEKLFDVSRKVFNPQPNVDSAVIEMKKRLITKEVFDIEFFKKFVRDCFLHKRKNIKNNLKKYDLEVVSRVLNKYGFDLNVRAEALSLDIFIEIVNELGSCN